jgi:predicted O-linked N-acetylglucosamine transferase (SPINDLY family)
VDELRRAIELEPKFKDAHDRLSVLLGSIGDLGGVMQSLQRTLQIFPHDQQAISNYLMTLNYLPDQSPQQIFDAHRHWGQMYADHMIATTRRHSNTPETHRRLRVGYVSPDFYNHPVAHFVRPIFANQHQDKFEVIAFSDVPKPDLVTRELERSASKWVATVSKTHGQLAELVRFEGIDVLIDLTGHTARNRLVRLPCARPQCRSAIWDTATRPAWKRWTGSLATTSPIRRPIRSRMSRKCCGCRAVSAAGRRHPMHRP